MPKKVFTGAEINTLRDNPYTLKVSPQEIRFTYEFQLLVLKQHFEERIPTATVFREAGYDPKLLGTHRMECIVRRIHLESMSEEGLKKPKKSREQELNAYETKELEKQQMRKTIRELQEEVQYLHQQIEFLKKIYQTGITRKSSD